MKSYRFSLFLIISLLFVQTLSLTHAVAHPFHAGDLQVETQSHSHHQVQTSHVGHAHELSSMDDWVCELFDSVPNSAIETYDKLDSLVAQTVAPGLVLSFVSSFSTKFYPSSWSRAPPKLN